MKSLSKIFARYLMTALMIILVTLFLNVFLYIAAGFRIARSTNRQASSSREIAAELQITEGKVSLSEKGYAFLIPDYAWAMLLNDSGQIIWSWRLPNNLNHSYTVREIAVFSKWYLDDYPVTERVTDYGLFVVASPRDSVWKYNVSDNVAVIDMMIGMIPVTLIVNIVFVFLLSLLLGFLFYRSLHAIAAGIECLSEQKPIHLPEKGMTEMLARQLNRASDILSRQKERLEQRDDARTAWISGVSHDIRTPLSLIMGYASVLKEDVSLTEERRQQAAIIELQSFQIKHLIEDLNLTSKLEYEMQPLRPAVFHPSGLLRKIVSDFYNQGLPELYLIELYIDPDVEQMTLNGDTALLERAFRNLIQNSIRHNPAGCTVTVTAYPEKGGICFQVSDTGCGIPKNVIQSLEGILPDTEKAPHIMGLRIVLQIFKAHGWKMVFSDSRTIHILYLPEKESDEKRTSLFGALGSALFKASNPRKMRTNTAESEN